LPPHITILTLQVGRNGPSRIRQHQSAQGPGAIIHLDIHLGLLSCVEGHRRVQRRLALELQDQVTALDRGHHPFAPTGLS
jgi:hypothetical protein